MAETPGKGSGNAGVIDQRLLPFVVLVRGGQVIERQWEFFTATYFPGMSDEDAREALLAWAERNGVTASLHLSSREPPRAYVRLTTRK